MTVSSFIDFQWDDLSDEEFMDVVMQIDESINESWPSKSNVITNVNDDGTFNISF